MLSPATIDIIKSTVPVLEKHGTDITKRFYELLFSNHPELLNVFNHANQKQGRQQAALAGAVYAAAQHIDNLEAIIPVVKMIGHKHRSLGIKAEHYPIVGRNLLAAIQDVLGLSATDPVVLAWGEAYGVIAAAFISVEADMYEQAEHQEGGWVDFRPFRVDRKVKESEEIVSFYLVPVDGKPIAAFDPGQYVSVKAEIPGEPNVHIRQYSLSDTPGQPHYRISVKRETGLSGRPDGKVSNYLHDSIEPGDILPLSAPAGSFTLDGSDSRPVVLIGGGVGLTPLVSMLRYSAQTNPSRPVTFIHAARNGDVHALKEEVNRCAAANPGISAYWCYEQPTTQDKERCEYDREGRIDLNWLQQIVPSKRASFYFCGPVPFMKAINGALREWGVDEADIHYEFFGPSGSLD